jgi:hypothetical protein
MTPLALLALCSLAADPKEPALREELLARVKTDQAARVKLIEAGNPPPKELLAAVKDADDANRAWLKGVIDKHGWPGKSLVGEDGAHSAFLKGRDTGVPVTKTTAIHKQMGKLVPVAALEDLKVGVKVSVWLAGEKAEAVLIFP